MADIPIVVVAYNRLESLKRILASLSRGEYPREPVELIISIDRGETRRSSNTRMRFPGPTAKNG